MSIANVACLAAACCALACSGAQRRDSGASERREMVQVWEVHLTLPTRGLPDGLRLDDFLEIHTSGRCEVMSRTFAKCQFATGAEARGEADKIRDALALRGVDDAVTSVHSYVDHPR